MEKNNMYYSVIINLMLCLGSNNKNKKDKNIFG
jgi:hypothetical protein